MANFATALKAEVVRLARREIRGQTLALQKASAAHRRQIAALRRQVVALERKAKTLVKNSTRAAPLATADEGEGGSVRFVAKGLKSLRARLGLSAGELGRLLGVSGQSVYNWENQKAVPRRAQVQALAQLRGLGKREVRARLEPAAGESAPRKRGRPAGSGNKAAKPARAAAKRGAKAARASKSGKTRGRRPGKAQPAKRAVRAKRSAQG
jgi:DNA-binding transcriptional regulator YiaG